MTVETLFTNIRFQISDEMKTGYKDNELLTYLNQTNDYVYSTLINHKSNLANKKATITMSDGEGSLPSDFQLEDAVKNADDVPLTSVASSITPNSLQYSMMRDIIYSDNDSLELFYFFMPVDYLISDTLTIPKYFENMYIQMIKFLVMNSDEYDTSVEQSLMVRFENTILDIAGKRGNTAPRAVMPFKV